MAWKVGEESLVLCSEWVKTGIEYKASLGGGGCCKLRELPRRGEEKTKSFDSSSKTVLEFKASLIAARFAK